MSRSRQYLDEAQQHCVREWWRALQPRDPEQAPIAGEWFMLGRADRAYLKRCTSLGQLLLIPAALRLATRLMGLEAHKQYPRLTDDFLPFALVAGALAHITEDRKDDRSLIADLGHSNRQTERPILSEQRFRRLQHTRDILENDDFYRQLIRTLQLANRRVNVAVLANDLVAWCLEVDKASTTPTDGVRFRWANDYYLSTKENSATADE